MIALDHEVTAEAIDLNAQVSTGAATKEILTSLDHFLAQVSDFAGLAGDDLDRLGLPAIGDQQQRLLRINIDELFQKFTADAAALRASVTKAALDSSNPAEQTKALLQGAGNMTDLDAEMRSILNDYSQLSSAFEASDNCQRWAALLDKPSTTTAPVTTTTPPPTTAVPTTAPATTVPATTTPTTIAPTTVPPPTAAPTTVDLYPAAREQYLAAADEYDNKMGDVWASFWGSSDYILYRDAPVYCDQLATLQREWVDRMNMIAWPADAQDEAQAHLAESAVLLSLLDECAAAPGTRAGEEALLTAIEDESATYYAAVDALRIAIGLPPVNSD